MTCTTPLVPPSLTVLTWLLPATGESHFKVALSAEAQALAESLERQGYRVDARSYAPSVTQSTQQTVDIR